MNSTLEKFGAVMASPIRYVEGLLKIRDKMGSIIPLKLNPVQKKLMGLKRRALLDGRKPRFLILKARREGITTLEQALNFYCVATRPNQQVATLAHENESTEKIFRIANLFYDKLPKALRPKRLTGHSKRDLNFTELNSLFYIGTAGSRGFSRGDTINRVHWSEVAWSRGSKEDQRALLAGLTEACSNGEIVLESTPNGIGNLFHEKFSEALKGENEWTAVFFPWWEDSSYRVKLLPAQRAELEADLSDEEKELMQRHGLDVNQIAWRREQRRELRHLFPQEYPEDPETCFIVSGSCFFDRVLISAMLETTQDPLEVRGEGEVRVWEKPVPGRRYAAGADVAEGTPTGNYSVMGVLDVETEDQVACLRGKFPPEDFAKRCAALCNEYNGAFLGVERNNHGHSCLNTLVNTIGYSNLYYYSDYDPSTQKSNPRLGWETNGKTRPILLDDLREHIEKGFMRTKDRELLSECRTFGPVGASRYEAQEGCHDDSIFAWGIAIQVRKHLHESMKPTIVPASSPGAPEAPRQMFPMAVNSGNYPGRLF